ncbi:MAG TPA: MarR family transcriptional regulator [Chloroflexota bacterium]|nr:MarR family transcriptional regulator [Chloroflexota bacterium]
MQVVGQAAVPEFDEDVRGIAAAWSTLLRRSMLPRVQEHWIQAAGLQLDRTSYWLLRLLGEKDNLRLSELAQRQGTDVSTACRQVRHCEEAGLVEREGDPSDLRAVLFRLTDSGREALSRMQAVRMAVFDNVFAEWPARERQQFARLTTRFVDSYLAELEATS